MELEPELHDMFIAEAAADGRPPAQVLHDLIRDYVERRQQARDYDDFVRRKVEISRRQWDAGRHVSNEEAEADAAARRERLLQRTAAAIVDELAPTTGTPSDLC
ncbi:antitoxin of toxin-antitoxin stability system (plasmid) [Tistrella mobilis]|uniref:antitoxin of toxin-antitoxin stability system n=1 Tax=Tistrella mobilis TaxID=171437 RepID=UPI003558DADA